MKWNKISIMATFPFFMEVTQFLEIFRNNKLRWLITALVFLVCCFYLYHETIHLYPSFIHAWTQSDRLAIAMNFQQNGFDFFHPATFNLLTKGGITQVDFPIHDYLVAIIGSITNMDLVTCFRLYNVGYSLIGLYFIFKLTHCISHSFWKSFLVAFFVFTIPFYTYYQAGFLPSVPSFANLFIGLYFLFSYQKNKAINQFYIAVGFITLAALARLPLFVFFVAVGILQGLKWVKIKKIDYREAVALLVGILAFIAYFLYNKYLAATYGTMFLHNLLPIESFSHFASIVYNFLDRWSTNILGTYHAIFLLISLVLGTYFIYQKGFKNQLQSLLIVLFLISLVGVSLFFIVMGKQFVDHDYYLIDTFLPLAVMLLIACLAAIELNATWKVPLSVLSIIFCFYFITESKTVQKSRYEIPYNDQLNYSVNLYKKSAPLLEEWGINKEDTILFLNTRSTNIPLSIWNRKGYTVLNTREDTLRKFLAKPFDYAVLIDSFRVSDVIANYPDIIYQLDRKFEHKGVAVYEKTKNMNEIGFFSKFINKRDADFETSDQLKTFEANTNQSYPNDTSSLALEILPDNEYNLAFKDTLQNLLDDKRLNVLVKADYLNLEDSSRVNLVCQVGDFYESRYFSVELKDTSVWQEKLFHFKIPIDKIKNNQEMVIYYWNHGKSRLYVDNYSLIIFQ